MSRGSARGVGLGTFLPGDGQAFAPQMSATTVGRTGRVLGNTQSRSCKRKECVSAGEYGAGVGNGLVCSDASYNPELTGPTAPVICLFAPQFTVVQRIKPPNMLHLFGNFEESMDKSMVVQQQVGSFCCSTISIQRNNRTNTHLDPQSGWWTPRITRGFGAIPRHPEGPGVSFSHARPKTSTSVQCIHSHCPMNRRRPDESNRGALWARWSPPE